MDYPQCCLDCLKFLPWGTLLATTLCWGGTIVFCTSGFEAITISAKLLESMNVSGIFYPSLKEELMAHPLLRYIYGIAILMSFLSFFLLVDGTLSTKMAKNFEGENCKSSCSGINFGLFCGLLLYIANVCWLLLLALSATYLGFYMQCFNQCYHLIASSYPQYVCVDFTLTGLVAPPISTQDFNYGRLCGAKLYKFCESPRFVLTYRLFLIAFFGALAATFSVIHYLMCFSANMTYLKIALKIFYRKSSEVGKVIYPSEMHRIDTFH